MTLPQQGLNPRLYKIWADPLLALSGKGSNAFAMYGLF